MKAQTLHLSEWADLRTDYAALLRSDKPAQASDISDVARRMVDKGVPILEFDALHQSIVQDSDYGVNLQKNAQSVRTRILAVYDQALIGLRCLEHKYRSEVFDRRKTTESLSHTAEVLAASRDNLRSEVMIQQRVLEEKNNELETLNQKILAQRDELRGFLYAISHDLKTPANTVTGLVTQFLEDHPEAEIDRIDLEDAISTANRMKVMLDDLLNFSQALDGCADMGTVDLNTLVEDIVSDLSGNRADRNAEFVQDRLPRVAGSEFQLRLLFQNLIANGAKFCPPDRTPCVRIVNKGPRGISHAAIAVADNGIGIDPAYHDKIFGLFNRLHTYSEYPGTGLGLSLCKRIVLNHKAQIHLMSAPGEGSTFTVVLPI